MADFTEPGMGLKSDLDVFIDLGLPGCFAMGFVPGSRRGKIRRQDPYHEVLADAVLKLYRRIEVYEADAASSEAA